MASSLNSEVSIFFSNSCLCSSDSRPSRYFKRVSWSTSVERWDNMSFKLFDMLLTQFLFDQDPHIALSILNVAFNLHHIIARLLSNLLVAFLFNVKQSYT